MTTTGHTIRQLIAALALESGINNRLKLTELGAGRLLKYDCTDSACPSFMQQMTGQQHNRLLINSTVYTNV